MAHPSHGSRLGYKARAEPMVQQVVSNELDRHISVERFVVGENDDAHSATPEQMLHSIGLADQRARLEMQTKRG